MRKKSIPRACQLLLGGDAKIINKARGQPEAFIIGGRGRGKVQTDKSLGYA